MNDVTFVEAARVLAQRVLREAGPSDDARLTRAFRLVVARPPRAGELAILRDRLAERRAFYRQNARAAARLAATGEAPRPPDLDVVELAANSVVCNILLNLDEAITKE
jgi:hypothetical protein